VLKWTAENSTLPDLSFWVTSKPWDALLGHGVRRNRVLPRETWRGPFVDGKSPSELQVRATVKGAPAISLSRATALGIKVRADYYCRRK
jgi:hypothetical protein